jgi:hypothetical protein
VIDHRTATQLAAAALDYPLEPADDRELRDHLAGCATCRARAAAIRADATRMREIDFGDPPDRLRARVAGTASAAAVERGVGPGTLVVLLGLLALLAAAAIAVGGGRPTPPLDGLTSDGNAPNPVRWTAPAVELEAGDFWIEAGGRRYLGAGARVDGDPGGQAYWTLEVEWIEHGRAMRLYLYFRSDGASWWVDEVRTYDGEDEGDWSTYARPDLGAPLGQAWVGRLRMTGSAGTTLHLDDLRIDAHPQQAFAAPPGGAIDVDADPFMAGGPLHCAGILEMTPADAHARLLELGYGVSWRFGATDEPVPGWSGRLVPPSAGTISDAAVGEDGSHGFIVVFVDPGDPVPAPTRPPDCP